VVGHSNWIPAPTDTLRAPIHLAGSVGPTSATRLGDRCHETRPVRHGVDLNEFVVGMGASAHSPKAVECGHPDRCREIAVAATTHRDTGNVWVMSDREWE